jgi:uncharacterized membrane protein
MHSSALHYFPVAWPALLVLLVLFGGAVVVVLGGIVKFASASMGISAGSMLALLLLALIGSRYNIPIGYLPQRVVSTSTSIDFFGVPYEIPMIHEWSQTVIAVNVGGAVIPTLLSLYLLVKNHLYVLGLAGIAVVTVVCHLLARPVYGLGIAEPVFIPPIITAVVAVALSRRYAAPLAYISGSLGTLIGADLLNLNKIQGLGAPMASIGGAGTFDGIFVTGLLAVVYAGVGMHLDAQKQLRAR